MADSGFIKKKSLRDNEHIRFRHIQSQIFPTNVRWTWLPSDFPSYEIL